MNATEKFKIGLKNLRKLLEQKRINYRNQKIVISQQVSELRNRVAMNCQESMMMKSTSNDQLSDIMSTLVPVDITNKTNLLNQDYIRINNKLRGIERLITILNMIINNFNVETASNIYL